jgi:predicted metalloprotease
MRFNPKARVDPGQIDSRGGGGGGGLGGGGMRLPIPTGGGGKLGVGGIVVIILFVVISMCTGNGVIPGGGSDPAAQQGSQGSTSCQTGADANQDPYNCGIDLLTTSIQDYWSRAYPDQTGQQYQQIQTVKYSGQTSSGCGTASSAMGPFYCPNDQRVYIDTSFMQQMLEGQLGAEGGAFALAYVLAPEYGHHIEDQLGILGKIRTQQGAKSDSVKVELMADCLAGSWAKSATTTKDADGNVIIQDLTQDDIARAIDAAQAVGDDRIQKQSSGRVNPEAWTHGSSEQRTHWFNVGLEEGTIEACNTFAPGAL